MFKTKQSTWFENLKEIKSKWQAPNLKNILTKNSLKSKLEVLNVLTKDVNAAQAYS